MHKNVCMHFYETQKHWVKVKGNDRYSTYANCFQEQLATAVKTTHALL